MNIKKRFSLKVSYFTTLLIHFPTYPPFHEYLLHNKSTYTPIPKSDNNYPYKITINPNIKLILFIFTQGPGVDGWELQLVCLVFIWLRVSLLILTKYSLQFMKQSAKKTPYPSHYLLSVQDERWCKTLYQPGSVPMCFHHCMPPFI